MSPKAKLLLKIVLPIYAVFVVAFLVVSLAFHERRDLVAEDAAGANLWLIERVSFEITEESPDGSRTRRRIEYPRGTVIDKQVFQMLQRGNRTKDVPVTGTQGVIAFDHTAVFQALNFVVFMLILYGLLWEPILKVLDERRQRIANDLDGAARERADAEKAHSEYRQRLAGAQKERTHLIEEGRRTAQAEARRIVDNAQQEGSRVLDRSREQLEAEIDRARADLRGEVAKFSVMLAQQILSREIKEEDHARVTESFLAEIEKDAQKPSG